MSRPTLICVTKNSSGASTNIQLSVLCSGRQAFRLAGNLILFLSVSLFAIDAFSQGQSQTETIPIDGVERRAIVYSNSKPPGSSGAPVVFVFHGHGGTAQYAARRFRIHELWPEAVVFYMQGIPGVQGITDAEGTRNGWQKNPGEVGDRDLKFFDSALQLAEKKYKADPNRVYVLGHSNGGRFVNVLWNKRGDKLAALCSIAGPGGRLIQDSSPKSVYIIAGEKDPLVPFQIQKNSIGFAQRVLKTDPSQAKVDGFERRETGVSGAELVTYIHPAGHEVPIEALPKVVSFFKRHARH